MVVSADMLDGSLPKLGTPLGDWHPERYKTKGSVSAQIKTTKRNYDDQSKQL
jgi:hypothetical protein